MGILLLGHYASERFAVERLAEQIRDQFPELLHCAASKQSRIQSTKYKISTRSRLIVFQTYAPESAD
jgi:hypothetical protein